MKPFYCTKGFFKNRSLKCSLGTKMVVLCHYSWTLGTFSLEHEGLDSQSSAVLSETANDEKFIKHITQAVNNKWETHSEAVWELETTIPLVCVWVRKREGILYTQLEVFPICHMVIPTAFTVTEMDELITFTVFYHNCPFFLFSCF